MSETGGREINEDCVGYVDTESLKGFFVCDGLGGHGKGDIASSEAVESFKNCFSAAKSIDDAVINTAYQNAHKIIRFKQKEYGAFNQMKTTAVILLINDTTAYISNIGDSRCYVFFEGGDYIRTKDHSVPEILHLSGEIKESEMRHHPDRNKLLRALGNECEEVKFETINPISIEQCKAFLLCTDGFWENVLEEQMVEALNNALSPEDWLHNMKIIIKSNGKSKSMDNYSAISVWKCEE